MLYAVTLTLLWLQAQPSAAEAPTTAMIVGRVIDAATGAPLAGATVATELKPSISSRLSNRLISISIRVSSLPSSVVTNV